MLRIKLKENAYEVANILKVKWHRRSRIKWLKYGDRNTLYFHAIASCKQSTKNISLLIVDGHTVINQTRIVQEFTEFYKKLFGTQSRSVSLPIAPLYLDLLQLHSLDDPFSEQEALFAVRNLADNKASDLDGLLNELFKIQGCSLCDLSGIEDGMHLFFHCPFTLDL